MEFVAEPSKTCNPTIGQGQICQMMWIDKKDKKNNSGIDVRWFVFVYVYACVTQYVYTLVRTMQSM